jgi:WD40 repeat protein
VLHSLLATGSSDGSVKLYTFDSSSTQYTLQQSIQLSPLIPLTLSLHSTIDGFLLAIGGSSPHIQLYASSPETISFSKVATLKGHEDWIRGLDFKSSQSDIFLASASQDRYIRLWKITLSTTTHTTNDIDALYTLPQTH